MEKQWSTTTLIKIIMMAAMVKAMGNLKCTFFDTYASANGLTEGVNFFCGNQGGENCVYLAMEGITAAGAPGAGTATPEFLNAQAMCMAISTTADIPDQEIDSYGPGSSYSVELNKVLQENTGITNINEFYDAATTGMECAVRTERFTQNPTQVVQSTCDVTAAWVCRICEGGVIPCPDGEPGCPNGPGTPGGPPSTCPKSDGSEHFQILCTAATGACDIDRKFDNAKQACLDRGKELVTVENLVKHLDLTDFLMDNQDGCENNDGEYFIGLSYKDMKFKWHSDSYSPFRLWCPGQGPETVEEENGKTCVAFSIENPTVVNGEMRGCFKIVLCARSLPFVCQRKESCGKAKIGQFVRAISSEVTEIKQDCKKCKGLKH